MRITRKYYLQNDILSQSLSGKFDRGTDVTSALCICGALKWELIEKSAPIFILFSLVNAFFI